MDNPYRVVRCCFLTPPRPPLQARQQLVAGGVARLMILLCYGSSWAHWHATRQMPLARPLLRSALCWNRLQKSSLARLWELTRP